MSIVDVPHITSLVEVMPSGPVLFVPSDPGNASDLEQLLAVDWVAPLAEVWQGTDPVGDVAAAGARFVRNQTGFESAVNRHVLLSGRWAGVDVWPVPFLSASKDTTGDVSVWLTARERVQALREAREAGDSTRATRNALRAAQEAADGLVEAACGWYAAKILQPVRAGVALLTPEGTN